MGYYVEFQHSMDGETWVMEWRKDFLGQFLRFQADSVNNYWRYVEYRSDGTDPLVLWLGERKDNHYTWKAVNTPRDMPHRDELFW